MYSVVIRPLITEKSIQDAKKGKFTFVVVKQADKRAITKEVSERFKVDVIGISTVTVKGRTQRTGKRRIEKVLTAWKKAIVTVKEGQKIDLFEVGGAQ